MRSHEVVSRVRAVLRPGGWFVGELGGQGNVATIREVVTEAVAAAGVVDWLWRSPGSSNVENSTSPGAPRI